MSVEGQTSETRERLNHRQTDSDIWYEVTVHHVDVQDACAAALDRLDLLTETRKVSGQN